MATYVVPSGFTVPSSAQKYISQKLLFIKKTLKDVRAYRIF